MSAVSSDSRFAEEHHQQVCAASPQIQVSDVDLWRQLGIGDQRAIAELYDRYSRLVYGVACHVLRDQEASEDILHEVFIQLWRVPDSFDPAKSSLATWLAVVSRRRAIDRLRQRRSEVDVADLISPVRTTQLADATLNQVTCKVNSLLNNMLEKVRALFELADFEGLANSEIGARLGDSLGTTKSRIRQTMKFIRTKLNGSRTDFIE